jgi:hypothetical protein
MNRWKLAAGTAALVSATFLGGVWAYGGSAAKADDTPAYPVPKPSPEHDLLKKGAGTWDASIESTGPDGKKSVSTGVETRRMMTGGLWMISDFKGTFGGQPFEGHGVTGFDPGKKKYIGTWVDTMSAGVNTMEETYDAGKKTMSGTMEGPEGKMKMSTEYKDENTEVFTMYMTGPDGKDAPMMTITYKRRK